MTGSAESLGHRFRQEIHDDGVLVDGSRAVVAVSGGIDSVVLLHLLRFTPGLPTLSLEAAHFDHGMRPGSSRDAQWVQGLCRAWGIQLHWASTGNALTSETEARTARYRFLLQVKERAGASHLLTGHQADDQAETVLHRAVRGTGLRGLAGIPRTRSPGLYRPLLSFSRSEVARYAVEERVPHREDPTNLDRGILRNALRHSILPALEGGPAPGTRQALVRLSRLARENEAAWDTILPELLDGILDQDESGDFVVRSALLAYHPAVRARLLRTVLMRAGIELDEAGTRVAVEFTTSGASGKSLSLPGGRRWTREFDKLRLEEETEVGEVRCLILENPEWGTGQVELAGSTWEVEWGPAESGSMVFRFEGAAEALAFPLTLRGWEAGDRIELPYGTKKLKKLFGEAKLPVRERERIPVLLDGLGRVLWVPGIAISTHVQITPGSDPFFIGIRNADAY